MARNKKIYRIEINNELKALGFNTKMIGSQKIIPEIKRFAQERKYEILGLSDPEHLIGDDLSIYIDWEDVPNEVRITEVVTKLEVIQNQVKGYSFNVDNATFTKDPDKVDGDIYGMISKYKRASLGKLRSTDWIGYVHSSYRNSTSTISKSIMKQILRKAISKGFVFTYFDVFSEGWLDKDAFLESVFTVMAKHKVYDIIIEGMDKEPGSDSDNTYEKKRMDIERKIISHENNIDYTDATNVYIEEMTLKIYKTDLLFSLNRSRRDKATYVDQNRDNLRHLSSDLKEAKIKERLHAQSNEVIRGKGINDTKKKRIQAYFKENPDSSIRKAALKLKINRRTITKHKLAPPAVNDSGAKNAPKVTIYNTTIVENGAKSTPPTIRKTDDDKPGFTKGGIRIRSYKKGMDAIRESIVEQGALDPYRIISKQIYDYDDENLNKVS